VKAKVIAAFLAGALLAGGGATALAHHGPAHISRYRQIGGPAWMPEHIVIRCSGWAEDSLPLRAVRFEPDRVILRCSIP